MAGLCLVVLAGACVRVAAGPEKGDKVDVLIQLLVKKGILSEQEARELRQEVETTVAPAPAKRKQIDWSFQYRLRPERRRDNDLNHANNDNTFFAGQRLRLNASYAATPQTRLFVQLQDSRVWGTEQSTASNEGNLDLHQGYVELTGIAGGRLNARLGRQELSFGDERLIGAFGWSNVGRSFDAVQLSYPYSQGTLHAWAALTKEGEMPLLATGAPRPDQNEYFYGLYNEWRNHPDVDVDAYLLWRDADAGSVDHWTLGGRAKGRLKALPVDYSAELAYQFGDEGAKDFSAHAGVASVGYTWDRPYKPRLSVEYAFASGDSNPADNKTGTFDQLFPTNHNKYGYIDQVGWRNMKDLHVGLSVAPTPKTKLAVDWHSFTLAEPRDSWYVASGAVKLTDPTGASGDDLGDELDLTWWYNYAPGQRYMIGYSRFFTGSYARNLTGVGDDTDWFFLQSVYDF